VESDGKVEKAIASNASVHLTIGFIPLVDCAALVVAREKGFAEAEGLSLTLVRETSWANIRDRVTAGHFYAAQMLAPMPIASSLGLGVAETAMIAPFSLGLGGNAVTLSTELFRHMESFGATISGGPMDMGRALARVVSKRRQARDAPLMIAVVHPFSAHNYELRYWLDWAGIDPDRDVQIVVTPPSVMGGALADGQIDGFCAGEPWNSLAVESGVGVIVVVKSALWRHGPEKVLGLRADVAELYPDRIFTLLRALHRAAEWAGKRENHKELATMLCAPAYLDTSANIVARGLGGLLVRASGASVEPIPDFLVFSDKAANFPWQSHAVWFASQMVRWGQISYSVWAMEKARRVYRPDLYRAALAPLGIDLPRASAKIEGALETARPVASRNGSMVLGPDGFFDGRLFDPDDVEGYLKGFGAAPEVAAGVPD
jgi:two-component system, oxyanion-binding sensor